MCPLRPSQSHKPRPAAPPEQHPGGTRIKPKQEALPLAQHEPWSHRHVLPAYHKHLHVLDAITISVIVTLVPNAIVVGVLLP